MLKLILVIKMKNSFTMYIFTYINKITQIAIIFLIFLLRPLNKYLHCQVPELLKKETKFKKDLKKIKNIF